MGPPRILIAGHHGTVVLETCKRLGRLGYVIAGLADSADATVRLAQELRPDLILMDLHLPGCGGSVEAAEWIAALHPPVVFFTAQAEAEVPWSDIPGRPPYLPGPFQDQDLRVTIDIALHKHRAEKKVRQQDDCLAKTLASINLLRRAGIPSASPVPSPHDEPSPFGVIATDPQGQITFLDPVAESLTGWKAAHARGQSITKLVRFEGGAGGLAAEDAVTACASRPVSEAVLLATGGKQVAILGRSAPVYADGEYAGSVFVFHTSGPGDRERAEDLRTPPTLAEQALEAVSQAILVLGPANEGSLILQVNRAFERITGYPRDKVIGTAFTVLQGPRTDPAVLGDVARHIQEGRPIERALLTYRQDGTEFWAALSLSPLPDEAGQETHFVGVMQDITPDKERDVAAREAQRLDAIGQLAGGVAHDFNNLLTVISGYLGLLRDTLTSGGEGALAFLEPIEQAQRRAASLTRQLLSFGRRQFLHPTFLDLNEVVRSLSGRLEEILGEGIELILDTASEPLTVKMDRGQLDQILRDLTVNAREAMTPALPGGTDPSSPFAVFAGGARGIRATGRLTVTTGHGLVGEGEEIPPGPYHFVRVTDTGRGMDEKTRARIFEPFFTTKEVGKGSGLGLASAYGAMKQSGGQIRVKSEPGRGAAFTLYFPPAPLSAATGREWPSHKVAGDLLPGTETVLLVEDEPVVRGLVGQVLRMSGYTVLEASDGKEALQVLEGNGDELHLLITDVLMPQISGAELARQVAQRRPGIRILFLSGYAENDLMEMGILYRGQPLLMKPFTPTGLARKVREVLDKLPAVNMA